MNRIRKTTLDHADIFVLENRLWGTDAYTNHVEARLACDENGFLVRFTVEEKEPLREKKDHFQMVHEDSCVEFFVNFTPELCNKYINFEVNAAGAMNASFRSDRYDQVPLKREEIEGLGIRVELKEDCWSVSYCIGYDLVRSYFPEFDPGKITCLKGNLYKCGDLTQIPHYLAYFPVGTQQPDYHRPEYFGCLEIE